MEKRKGLRQQTRIPVSFKCFDIQGKNHAWHMGVAIEISVDDMQIISNSLGQLAVSSKLEILCFPKKDKQSFYIQDPEPIRIKGRVKWQDLENKILGVELIT
jgi:hypothetical protein